MIFRILRDAGLTWTRLLVLASIFLLLVPASLQSADATEGLEEAISAWLDDRDDAAVPALAVLAASGNTDAQLLLGQIEQRSGALSPYLAAFGEDERQNLLKAPDGVSWLDILAADDPMAQAIRAVKTPGQRVDGFESLLDLGETGPAIALMDLLYKDDVGTGETVDLSLHPNFPREMQHFAWLSIQFPIDIPAAQVHRLDTDFHERLAENDLAALELLSVLQLFLVGQSRAEYLSKIELAKVLTGYVREGDLTEVLATPAATVVDQLLVQAPSMQTVAGLCEVTCPKSISACLRTLYFGLDGFWGISAIQTPVERLVPSARYLDSKRHRADILRTAHQRLSIHWGPSAQRVIEREADQCILQKALDTAGTSQ